MPLSEHEQRLLEQMERALYAEDPKFASSLRGADLRAALRRRVAVSVVAFVLGIAVLMTGLVVKVLLVSVLGFVAMLVAAFVALSSWRRISAPDLGVVGGTTPRSPRSQAGKGSRSSGGLMHRFEDRWDRRRDERDR